MGHGPARELSADKGPAPELKDEYRARISTALERMDKLDPEFKQIRDEEKYGQITKAWHRVCAEIDGHLRAFANSVINAHQISLDIGSEGGGVNAKPFLEEVTGRLERLYFKVDGDGLAAVSGGRTIAKGTFKDVSYEWVERVGVEWLLLAIGNYRKH